MTHSYTDRFVIALSCVISSCNAAPLPAQRDAAALCAPSWAPRLLSGLREASGAALSRRTPGVLWSLNDSGAPIVHAVDAATGSERGRVRIPNASVEDWEDVSVGPCPGGSCLYVADIGDNNRVRRSITIYRVAEPQPQDGQSAPAEVFTAVYPDGPHDAEAVFIAGDDLFIITKDATSALYRLPRPLKAGANMTLERVGRLSLLRVTDAETSADGAWVAVRSNDQLGFYRTTDLTRGTFEGLITSVRSLQEPQGEGVALAANGTVYLTGEGQRAGSLNTLRCTLPK